MNIIKKRNLTKNPQNSNCHIINYKMNSDEMWQYIKGYSQNSDMKYPESIKTIDKFDEWMSKIIF